MAYIQKRAQAKLDGLFNASEESQDDNLTAADGSAAPADLTYTVQKGDSLSGIAANLLGDGGPKAVGMIMAENSLTGETIYPGEVLDIGSLDQYGTDAQAQFQQQGQAAFNQSNARLAAQALNASYSANAESGTSGELGGVLR